MSTTESTFRLETPGVFGTEIRSRYVSGMSRFAGAVVSVFVSVACASSTTVILKVTGADVSTPPFATPPSSFTTIVMSAKPAASAASV